MLSPSKDKTDELYASLQAYLNIEDDKEIKISCNRSGLTPRWINKYKADLPNPKDPQHDPRYGKVK